MDDIFSGDLSGRSVPPVPMPGGADPRYPRSDVPGGDQLIDSIRPAYSPKFFNAVLNDPGLSPTAKDDIINSALSNRVNMSKIRSDLVRARQAERLGDLRIENDELRLAEARRNAADARTGAAQAGQLSTVFKGILDTPGLDESQKRNALARLRIDNARAFETNGALRDMYATAFGTFSPVPRPMTDAERRAERAEDRTLVDREEEARREPIEMARENLDADYKAFQGAKPQLTGMMSTPTSTDKFLDPAKRDAATRFVEARKQYLPKGIKVATDHADLMKQAGDVYEAERASLNAQIVSPGAPSRVSGISRLGLPSR
jgi:hypothetical protein